jgi:UDP-N-acetylglucosamine 1-carboxyvinyltransferase
VSGSKNASLPILCATVLVDGPVVLDGVPRLQDVEGMLHLLEALGVRSAWQDDGSLRLEVVDESIVEAPAHLVRTMRASFTLLGPLWAKRKRAVIGHPGGCVLGNRPVDLHLKGLAGIGAHLELQGGEVHAEGEVRGGRVYLGGGFGSTVLGTANVVMAAVLGRGDTVIDFAAQEPEVVDLCNFLNACGARIEGVGGHRLKVRGVERLHGCRWRVIPDRIEAGTLLLAGVLTRGEVEVLGAQPDHLAALIDRLRAANVTLEIGEREVGAVTDELRTLPLEAAAPRVARSRRARPAKPGRTAAQGGSLRDTLMADRLMFEGAASDEPEPPPPRGRIPFIRTLPSEEVECVNVDTLPYPGFPTDLQAQFMTLMCTARGCSIMKEHVYPDRFLHVPELLKLGAHIHLDGPTAIVHGDTRLSGATMMASDLRGSAALVMAGLVAEGTSEIRRVYHLDRGYENLHEKLASLGAEIERTGDG